MLANAVIASRPKDIGLSFFGGDPELMMLPMGSAPCDAGRFRHVPDFGDGCVPVDTYGYDEGDSDTSFHVEVLRQIRVLSYRLDFYFYPTATVYGGFAVECDGHDSHNITKQQAAYDRSRDRELLLRGIRVLRFTGSEIHHSPERCAADIYAMARIIDQESAAELDLWERASKQSRRTPGEK